MGGITERSTIVSTNSILKKCFAYNSWFSHKLSPSEQDKSVPIKFQVVTCITYNLQILQHHTCWHGGWWKLFDVRYKLSLKLYACKSTLHVCKVTPVLVWSVTLTQRVLELSLSDLRLCLPFTFLWLFCNLMVVASVLVPRLWRWNRPHSPLQFSPAGLASL